MTVKPISPKWIKENLNELSEQAFESRIEEINDFIKDNIPPYRSNPICVSKRLIDHPDAYMVSKVLHAFRTVGWIIHPNETHYEFVFPDEKEIPSV